MLSVAFLTFVIICTANSGLGVTKSALLPALFAISAEERVLIETRDGSVDAKYREEFTEISNLATGIVGQFGTGSKRHGWILRDSKGGDVV